MNVQDLIKEKLGVSIVEYTNREVSQIPAVAGRILSPHAGRLGFLLVNLSANDVYIGPFPDVSASKGIFVSPNGGSVSINYLEDFTLGTKDWYGVSAIASNCLIIEMVIQRGEG